MSQIQQVKVAIDQLIEKYREAFGEEPDNVTGMVIRSSVQRFRFFSRFGHRTGEGLIESMTGRRAESR